MLVSVKQGVDFSEGYEPSNATENFRDPPPPATQRNRSPSSGLRPNRITSRTTVCDDLA
jgi:hypothetical protein